MKRLLLLAFVLFAAVAAFGQTVLYKSSPILTWFAPTLAPDGSEFITGDHVRYTISGFPVSEGDIEDQAFEDLVILAVYDDLDPTNPNGIGDYAAKEATTIYLDAQERVEWQMALRTTFIDGGGNETDYVRWYNDLGQQVYDPAEISYTQLALLYTTRAADTETGIPFTYAPSSGSATTVWVEGPTGLADSEM